MSHPTYHFPVIAPLALLGVMARTRVRSTGTGVRWRGWAALVVLALIQVEWMFYLIEVLEEGPALFEPDRVYAETSSGFVAAFVNISRIDCS